MLNDQRITMFDRPHCLLSEQDLRAGLHKKGHVIEEMPFLAVVQGIYSCRPHCPHPGIFATCDIRKRGYPDGY